MGSRDVHTPIMDTEPIGIGHLQSFFSNNRSIWELMSN